jgi:hypothetical protein
VGNNPDPLASVGRAGMESTHHDRPSGVAASFQVREHPVAASAAESRNILSDDPSGSGFLDDAVHLDPEA